MNLREADRYSAREVTGRKPGAGVATCRFDFSQELMGTLVDLSMKGFGIEIQTISGSLVDEIQKMGSYMITIDFGNETIMAAVNNVWNMVVFEEGNMLFRGGVAIDVMSPEDRIILSNIIEKIRSGR